MTRRSLRRRTALLCGVAALLSSIAWPAAAASESLADGVGLRRRSVTLAMRWLQSQQLPDGGWGHAGVSSAEDTAAAVFAISSAGEPLSHFLYGGLVSPLDALQSHVPSETLTAGGTARLILAIAAGGCDPREFASRDLAARLLGFQQPNGRYGADTSDGVVSHSLVLLAMTAVDEPIPGEAATWLRAQQNADGSWSPFAGHSGDMESTSLAVQSLAAAGAHPDDAALVHAVSFVRLSQGSDAGFRPGRSAFVAMTTSTGEALQALTAAGESLLDPHLVRSGQSPIEALLQRQQADGSFVQEPGASEPSVVATAAAVMGLVGKPLPFRSPGYAVRRSLDWLHTQQLPDGSFGSGPVTADAVRAIADAGEDPTAPPWEQGDHSAVEALENLLVSQPVIRNDAGQLGKTLRATAAIGADPRTFGGFDLLAAMDQLYDPQSGWYHSGHAFKHALALEGLATLGVTVPAAAVQALLAEQHLDGGWGWPIGGEVSDNDTTGRILTALVKSGVDPADGAFESALEFLADRQLPNAGWGGFLEDSPSNSNSVALVTEGLLSQGQRLLDPPFAILSNQGALITPLDALISYQEGSGAFAYTNELPESRLLAVLDAIPALLAVRPEPQVAASLTTVATLESRVAAPGDLRLLLPISGDGDGDAQAVIRYRQGNSEDWTEEAMDRHGVLFASRLRELQPGVRVEIEVTLHDPDGVSGEATQLAIVTAPLGLWLPTVMR